MLDFAAFSASQPMLLKRDLEKKGTLEVLGKMYPGKPVKVCYTSENKPYLEDISEHISISHSHDKLVVLANAKESTGVDIELIRDKVINVRHKFLNEQEFEFAGSNVEALITLWAAKEAIYKAYGLKEVDFAKHLYIETNTFNETSFYGKLDLPGLKKRYQMKREKIDNYILVYIISEVQ
jgi:phosphopantetheinyl transferase